MTDTKLPFFPSTHAYLMGICALMSFSAQKLADFAQKYHTFPNQPFAEQAENASEMQQLQLDFAYRCHYSVQANIDMPLHTWIARRQLTQPVVHALMCCIAWELDPSFRQWIRKIPSFATTQALTLELIHALAQVCAPIDMPAFALRAQDLTLFLLPQTTPLHVLSPLRLHPLAQAFLLHQPLPTSDYITRVIPPQPQPEPYTPSVTLVSGEAGHGKKHFLLQQAAEKQTGICFCDAGEMMTFAPTLYEKVLQELVLTAHLFPCRVCILHVETLTIEKLYRIWTLYQRLCAQQTILCMTAIPPMPSYITQTFPCHIQTLPLWDNAKQKQLLQTILPALPPQTQTALSDTFDLSPKQWHTFTKEVQLFAPKDHKTLFSIALSHTGMYLSTLAEQIPTVFDWEDLVLPEDLKKQIQECCYFFQYRKQVYDTWGMGERIAYGRGLNILFSGPPGTGKTMLAQVIANELQLELYRIDLSSVVSKYIGETEKNLEKIFDEAQKGSCILFFDEMDALFGKRSETKDAHDKYANLETAYLLQRLEQYDGVVLMATNYFSNIDEAFLRRIHFVFHIPFPDAVQRRQLWQKAFPSTAPLAADIDFDFLSTQFRLSGAQIKQIALSAAVFSAAHSSTIRMQQIIQALAMELYKQNRTLCREDFGKYQYLFDFFEEDG